MADADRGSAPAGVTGASDVSEIGLRQLEEEYVHRVYNAIASHFSSTRCATACVAVSRVEHIYEPIYYRLFRPKNLYLRVRCNCLAL